MRMLITLGLALIAVPLSLAQEKEERRFGLRYTPELYSQATPKTTLVAALRAFDKDRYDYLVAFLLDPAFVEEQLRASYETYEILATKQVLEEGLAKKGFDKDFIRKRIKELASIANFEHLVSRVRTKLENDPDALQDIRKMYGEGVFQDAGDTNTAKHPEIKGRALFFRKIDDRWYIENKMLDE